MSLFRTPDRIQVLQTVQRRRVMYEQTISGIIDKILYTTYYAVFFLGATYAMLVPANGRSGDLGLGYFFFGALAAFGLFGVIKMLVEYQFRLIRTRLPVAQNRLLLFEFLARRQAVVAYTDANCIIATEPQHKVSVGDDILTFLVEDGAILSNILTSSVGGRLSLRPLYTPHALQYALRQQVKNFFRSDV